MGIVAHRIQLQPNNTQSEYFRRACGVKRFAWNWALHAWDRQFRERSPAIIDDFGSIVGYEKRTVVDGFGNTIQKCNAQSLKKEFSALIDTQWPWMRITTSYAYQRVFPELEQAYQRFFKGLAEKPRSKAKGKSRDSFYLANTCISVDGRHVKIQKLGTVRMRQPLRFHGKIMSARVSRDADRWMISIAVEIPDVQATHKQPTVAVGVDMGIKVMAALSTGEVRENPRAARAADQRMKRLQRRLSRQMEAAKVRAGVPADKPMPRGVRLETSGRMKRVKTMIARLHRRISGLRSNAQHQLSAELTKRFGVIAIEDLNVKGMTASAKGDAEKPGKRVAQKAGLNRSILDVGFGELRRQLDYKSKRCGSTLVAIDRFFPSSKTCSSCGIVQESMPLSVREWTCPECNTTHDRDINAAKNIKAAGLLKLAEPVVAKEVKRTGVLSPKRKASSAKADNTGGVPEFKGRGEAVLVKTLDEASTRPGYVSDKPVDSSLLTTHSLVMRTGDGPRLQGSLF